MRCAVTLLRRHGRRLRAAELATPVVGDLEVTDHEGDSTFRRVLRVANLWGDASSAARRGLLVPLWEPSVLRIGPGGLSLHGIELDGRGDRVCEHVQVWRCVLV
jgi:hypothetical protein